MLNIRISSSGSPWLRMLGLDVAASLRAHPLATKLHALVLLGVGDPALVRPGDPDIKVMVPLIGSERADALGQAQMRSMSALVLIDAVEAPEDLGRALPVVVPGDTRDAPGKFLRGASAFDEMEADMSLASMPVLKSAVGSARPSALGLPITGSTIADATIEAIVLSRSRDD